MWTHEPNILVWALVKFATVVEGDRKAPFSIATTLRCREGRDSFPRIAPLYPWYVPYIAECWARRYQVPFLKSLVWRDLGLNPGLPDHWRTLYPLGQWAGYYLKEMKKFTNFLVNFLEIFFFFFFKKALGYRVLVWRCEISFSLLTRPWMVAHSDLRPYVPQHLQHLV